MVHWGACRELLDGFVALRAPRQVGEKRFATLPAGSRRGHITPDFGVRGLWVKVLRTFGADMTAFTTLLRELSHSGDASGRMTYDDSGARLVFERRGGAERAQERHGLVSDVGTPSLEGASDRN